MANFKVKIVENKATRISEITVTISPELDPEKMLSGLRAFFEIEMMAADVKKSGSGTEILFNSSNSERVRLLRQHITEYYFKHIGTETEPN